MKKSLFTLLLCVAFTTTAHAKPKFPYEGRWLFDGIGWAMIEFTSNGKSNFYGQDIGAKFLDAPYAMKGKRAVVTLKIQGVARKLAVIPKSKDVLILAPEPPGDLSKIGNTSDFVSKREWIRRKKIKNGWSTKTSLEQWRVREKEIVGR